MLRAILYHMRQASSLFIVLSIRATRNFPRPNRKLGFSINKCLGYPSPSFAPPAWFSLGVLAGSADEQTFQASVTEEKASLLQSTPELPWPGCQSPAHTSYPTTKYTSMLQQAAACSPRRTPSLCIVISRTTHVRTTQPVVSHTDTR